MKMPSRYGIVPVGFSAVDPRHLTRVLDVQGMLTLSEAYHKSVEEEATLTPEQLKTRHVGKQDPKRHLEEAVEKAMGDQVVQTLGTMLLAEL
jgi:26S proteasome regulatory subunit N11